MAGRKRNPTRHWLIQARHDKGMTFKEIALKIGVTTQCLYYWEIGERTPKPSLAQKLASVLGFDWTKFYEDSSIHNKKYSKKEET